MNDVTSNLIHSLSLNTSCHDHLLKLN